MSIENLIPQGCDQEIANLGEGVCFEKTILPQRMWAKIGYNQTIPVATLQDEALLKAEIASGNLIPLPRIIGIPSLEQSAIEVDQSETGFYQVTDREMYSNADFEVQVSQCTFRKMETLIGKALTIFVVGDGKVAGSFKQIDSTLHFKGINSQISKHKAFMFKANRTDRSSIPMKWLVVKADNNASLAVDYDPVEINGMLDVSLTVTSSSTGGAVVELKSQCDQIGIGGLSEVTDWSLVDSTGATVTITGVTDNGEGSYLIEATLTAETEYAINLNGVAESEGNQYAPLTTAVTFETPA